jgi:Zn-finger protein
MRMFLQMVYCPCCKETSEHRILAYGDGTAVAWCSSCHNPHELLVTQIRPRRVAPSARVAAPAE